MDSITKLFTKAKRIEEANDLREKHKDTVAIVQHGHLLFVRLESEDVKGEHIIFRLSDLVSAKEAKFNKVKFDKEMAKDGEDMRATVGAVFVYIFDHEDDNFVMVKPKDGSPEFMWHEALDPTQITELGRGKSNYFHAEEDSSGKIGINFPTNH